MVKNPLKLLWKDTCTIQTAVKVKQLNKAIGHVWTNLVTDEPCKLSFFNNVQQNNVASGTVAAAPVIQQAKLFIRSDLEVPPGSRIKVITHENKKTLFYKCSSKAALFTNHQEILMEVDQEWA